MRIKDFEMCVDKYVAGIYRYGGCRCNHGSGRHLVEVALWDATGTACAVLDRSRADVTHLQVGCIISVQGTIKRSKRGQLFMRLTHCEPSAVPGSPSWYLLPRCWVPSRAMGAFDQLLGLLDDMDDGPVRSFVEHVFADASVAKPFLRIRASNKHHHAYSGGLLIHSVECANVVASISKSLGLVRHEYLLGLVASLLHDISKIRILPDPEVNPQPVYGVAQEALNLEVLAPFLSILDSSWPEGSKTLREVLAPVRRSNANGGFAPLLLTDLVRYADHLSSGADLRRCNFQKLAPQKHCTRTAQGHLLARVPPPSHQRGRERTVADAI